MYKEGQVVNQLKLLEVKYRCDEHRKRKYWKCQCLRCGNIKVIREDRIKEGQKTCGCLSKFTRHRYLRLRSKYEQTRENS